MVPVLVGVAALVVGYFTFEWLRASRLKKRLAAGRSDADRLDHDPDRAALDRRSDPDVNTFNYGTGPHAGGGGVSGGGF